MRVFSVGRKNGGKVLRAERKGFLIKGVSGFGRRDFKRDLGDNRTVIGESINLKKSDGAFGFTVDDLPRTGSGSTISRQGRGVNVNDFVLRNINHRFCKIGGTISND